MGIFDVFKKPFRTVTVPEALTLLDEGALLVDVRSKAEFKAGHARQAKNVELRDVTRDVPTLARGRQVVVTCKSGARSSAACQELLKHGFADVLNLRGGMMAWRAAGQPVVGSGGKVGDIV